MTEKYRQGEYGYGSEQESGSPQGVGNTSGRPGGYDDEDVFGHEEGHDVHIPVSTTLPRVKH